MTARAGSRRIGDQQRQSFKRMRQTGQHPGRLVGKEPL